MRPFNRLCLLLTFSGLGVQLHAESLEGYWKYTEEAIERITGYTLEARRTGEKSGDSSADEIGDAYRNHIREFRMLDDNRVHIRLIQFEQNSDPYPEYYRDFYLDYVPQGTAFALRSGEREVFSGQIEDGILNLIDANTATVLTMDRVSEADLPIMSDENFSQPQLDRQPKARKLVEPDYPPELEQRGISGIVQLSFFVNVDGTTSEIKVLSSPHPGLERIAIEAILESTFHPGRVGREPVRTHVKLPITFR